MLECGGHKQCNLQCIQYETVIILITPFKRNAKLSGLSSREKTLGFDTQAIASLSANAKPMIDLEVTRAMVAEINKGCSDHQSCIWSAASHRRFFLVNKYKSRLVTSDFV